MSSRSNRREIAKETVEILGRGWYETPSGVRMHIADRQSMAEEGSYLIRDEDWPEVIERCKTHAQSGGRRFNTRYEVLNETTFQAARRLSANAKVLSLNFASARNAGGGFLNGASAQEEALCRQSGLYPCLTANWAYYEHNRAFKNCLYSDYMIYSPEVPVFRNDHDELTDQIFTTSVITAPAPNRGALEQNNPRLVSRIPEVFESRIEKVLALAMAEGYHQVVLGAWGCGAFRNDTAAVAGYFYHQLTQNPLFKGVFSQVTFAILDKSKEERFIQPFREQFKNA